MGEFVNKPSPRAIIIAGPNGAGKTTFANEFLPSRKRQPVFINADLIAAGLSPFRPDSMAMESSRIVLLQIRSCVKHKKDFAIETTLAGRAYKNLIAQWQNEGYYVELLFLKLPVVEMAVERVQERVIQGGHSIARHDIIRRFNRGIDNFNTIYQQVVNKWRLFDASFCPPQLLEQGANP